MTVPSTSLAIPVVSSNYGLQLKPQFGVFKHVLRSRGRGWASQASGLVGAFELGEGPAEHPEDGDRCGESQRLLSCCFFSIYIYI